MAFPPFISWINYVVLGVYKCFWVSKVHT